MFVRLLNENIYCMRGEYFLIISNFDFVLIALIFATLALKAGLFFTQKSVNKRYYDPMYCKEKQVVFSSSEQQLNIKIIQNSLTYYLVFLVLLEGFLTFLSVS